MSAVLQMLQFCAVDAFALGPYYGPAISVIKVVSLHIRTTQDDRFVVSIESGLIYKLNTYVQIWPGYLRLD